MSNKVIRDNSLLSFLWGGLDKHLMLSEIYGSRKMATMLALAFSAGLPIMLVYVVLSGWLREAGVSRSTIGFFVWVGFAYSLKFIWAPIVDRLRVPGFSQWLGNRRGWTLLAILGTALALLAMGFQDPSRDLAGLAVCAVLIAFSSATLDICVDAWRIEAGDKGEQASLAAVYQIGYRFGMMMAVSGGLFVAEFGGFKWTYWAMASVATVGALAMLIISQPTDEEQTQISGYKTQEIGGFILKGLTVLITVGAFLYFGLQENGFLRLLATSVSSMFAPIGAKIPVFSGAFILAFILSLPFLLTIFFMSIGREAVKQGRWQAVPIIGDFAELTSRLGWMTLLVLAVVVTYRISDTTMGVMTLPLYIDLGYSKDVIGLVKGFFGITIFLIGAILAGQSVSRFGMSKTLIIGAILTILTNLAFTWLAQVKVPHSAYLFITIGADNIAGGFAGTVFIAFMSIMTNVKYSATQYALFSSMFAFYGKSIAGFSGVLADKVGYEVFFIITAFFGIPALLLVLYAAHSGFTASLMVDHQNHSSGKDANL